MQQVQIADQLYNEAKRRATDAGFSSVDEYIAEIVSDGLSSDDLDHFFTPERLAAIDKSLAEIKAGNFFTREQADLELAARRAEWLRENRT